ncbi:hypothetical protein CERSUDRAFT_112133 [Gelatoporia subvermispora B]|uniref:Uncharacterized protein n=1 Tax=Ceriporiopsis subvermispora (strain B) TaxID=914234 RepID=M2RM00_CERS8|nr:hypothetical protein CERSUDRAFT_112133 [Gelatoporia subvermispora B]
MSNYFLTDNNWREYREAVRQNLPAVPLLPVIIRDVAQCREALERVPSMIGPPVSGPIPLPYYRNLRRTVRDLEACYGAHNVQRVDLVHYWLMKQTESLRDETYDRYSQYLMELSLRQEPRIDHH